MIRKITSIIVPVMSLLILLSSLPSYADSFNDEIINTFKSHPKVKEIIKSKEADGYEVDFNQVSISGMCGVVGCSSTRLVVMTISTPRGEVNPQSRSVMAIVSGTRPGRFKPRLVSFVELKSIVEPNINF